MDQSFIIPLYFVHCLFDHTSSHLFTFLFRTIYNAPVIYLLSHFVQYTSDQSFIYFFISYSIKWTCHLFPFSFRIIFFIHLFFFLSIFEYIILRSSRRLVGLDLQTKLIKVFKFFSFFFLIS